MKNLIIKHFFLNREFKIFGELVKVKRAATPTIIAFFIGVLLQTIIDGGWVATLLCWLPFVGAIYLGFFKNDLKYGDIKDWNQQLQYLLKPDYIGTDDETAPTGAAYTSEIRRLTQLHNRYFNDKDNVDVLVGLAPTWITLIGAALYILLRIVF